MKYYAGLDVSLKETFVSIVDEKGKVMKEASIPSDGKSLTHFLKNVGVEYEKVGIESGQLSISLCKDLSKADLDVVCIDARQAAAAMSSRINKNDKNDAREIAHLLRTGYYKEVTIKSDDACDLKVLLGSRRQLLNCSKQMKGTIRGLLKIYGIKLGTKGGFIMKVEESIANLTKCVREAIGAMMEALKSTTKEIEKLDKQLKQFAKEDEDCKKLMSIPGVGAVVAVTYKSTIDNPQRFEDSATVGAYLGLTPKQYSSGQVNRQGRVSLMGPKECRTMLYEAAQCLLTRCKSMSKLKKWGLKLMRKKGKKKAIVALARKLGVIMHRMLINQQEFCY